MTPIEHAAQAYADYRAKCGLAWQEDELDAEKFMVSVVPRIEAAVASVVPTQLPLLPHEQSSPDLDKLTRDTENGQQSGQTGLQIGVLDGQVYLQFDTMIRHMSLPPKAARTLAELVRKCSYQAEGKDRK